MGGAAKLQMANPGGDPFEEDGGILFSAMPPSKKYRDIKSLSGGEKSIASLALLLAMHACSPPPFFNWMRCALFLYFSFYSLNFSKPTPPRPPPPHFPGGRCA